MAVEIADRIRRIVRFKACAPIELARIAHLARVFEVPANRTLVRRGRPLRRDMFLLRGEVALGDERTRMRARAVVDEPIARKGDDRILHTLTACEVLFIDLASVSESPARALLPVPKLLEDDDWITRLLTGPTLRHFAGAAWQALLGSGEVRQMAAGAIVFDIGDPDDAVYVVRDGTVLLANRSTAHEIGTGRFFGEESALTGEPRAYRATMCRIGSVVAFPGAAIRRLATVFEQRALADNHVDIDVALFHFDMIETLPRDRQLKVSGGQFGERAVLIAKLLEAGFDVTV